MRALSAPWPCACRRGVLPDSRGSSLLVQLRARPYLECWVRTHTLEPEARVVNQQRDAASEMWELRVSVLGVSKSVEVDPLAPVSELASAVRRAFKASDASSVSLSGGFPPRALCADAVVRDVTTDKALVRAVVVEAAASTTTTTTHKKNKKGAKRQRVSKEATEPEEALPRARRRGSSRRGASSLEAALLGDKTKEGLFLRAAMRSEMLSRLEQRKAEDRYAAMLSGAFEVRDKARTLGGSVAEVEVSFAVDASLGRRSTKRHTDVVEALGDAELQAALRAVDPADRAMLEPAAMARCSPRVFWALVRRSGDVESALSDLVPDLDSRLPLPAHHQTPEEPPPQEHNRGNNNNNNNNNNGEEQDEAAKLREMRALAAEARASSPETRDDVDQALLDCVEGDAAALRLLARANIAAPRDLALWSPCPDVLAEMIGDEEAPPVDTLQRWAARAETMIEQNPRLKEFFAAPLTGDLAAT